MYCRQFPPGIEFAHLGGESGEGGLPVLGCRVGTQEFGGGFVYTMKDNLIDLGFVVGLDYENPRLDGHQIFQQFKTHPFIREMLKGGEVLSYGAKAIPEG